MYVDVFVIKYFGIESLNMDVLMGMCLHEYFAVYALLNLHP